MAAVAQETPGGEAERVAEAALPPAEARRRLETAGTLQCRGALPPEALAPLAANAERFFHYLEYCGLNNLPTPERERYNATVKRMAANLFCLLPRSEPVAFPLLKLLRESWVFPLLQDWLGSERVLLLFHHTRVRKVYPDSHLLGPRLNSRFPFHQDGAAVGADLRTINLWVPLTPCGEDAPALELAARPMSEVLPIASNADPTYKDFDPDPEALARALAGAPLWRPCYTLGDAQLIPCTTIHRSHIDPGMVRPRVSAELRFAAEGDLARFPNERRPILL